VSSSVGSGADAERYRRVELVNHVGYAVATVAASLGLFTWDAFMRLAASYFPVVLLVAAVAAALVAYFGSRIVRFARDPVVLPDPVPFPDDA
jgi:hypothetical protein